ncbi:DASH complex subunit ask1 [Coemansia sp. IMI 203386]|nr:DASH complex subunit ask1 [Coemansia sp. IMI 203386]
MSNFKRQFHLARPDSRASHHSGYSIDGSLGSGTGRFTNALSAALRRDDHTNPTILGQPTAQAASSPEEQLEEIEQKITLTLQSIDANFDHCQRTMARDIMPKVETLAKLSSELLEASQPWLQFFMAVASADDQDDGRASRSEISAGEHMPFVIAEDDDDEETRHMALGMAQRAAIEEQAHKGDITARFPQNPNDTVTGQWRTGDDMDNDDDAIDIDADIATPQLTSRFMTQELGMASGRKHGARSYAAAATPDTNKTHGLKRIAEQLGSVSAKKRRIGGTPMKENRAAASGAPKTPLSLMRALVSTKPRGVSIHGVPGSAFSHVSKNSSSMGTDDLMPDTSPPHTTTFTLPKSRRRIAPARGTDASAVRGSSGALASDRAGGQEDDEDDDDIMDEINSLIKRYDSPKPPHPASTVSMKSTISTSRLPASAAKSEVPSSNGDEMAALAVKYSSPEVTKTDQDTAKVRGLVADMEEMLEEVEAMAQQQAENDAEAPNQSGHVSAAPQSAEGFSAQHIPETIADEVSKPEDNVDDFDDDIPSPPQISSDLNGSRVDVPEIPPVPVHDDQPIIVPAAASGSGPSASNLVAAAVGGGGNRPANPARRTFGGSRNMLRMDLEEMDNENMTIGHMSPLANRGRQTMFARENSRQAPLAAASTTAAAVSMSTPPHQESAAAGSMAAGARFHSLGSMVDADDPFGPTPERSARATFASGERYRSTAAVSVQSIARSEGDFAHTSTRPWGVSSQQRGASAALGSEATATYDEQLHSGDAIGQNDESGLTIEQFDSGFTQASIDGTTSILPTREMLQQAARAAESNAAPAEIPSDIEDDMDGDNQTRNSAAFTDTQGHSGPLVAEFSLDLFPPAFRSEPASLQLRELYDLVRSQDQRIWSLEDLATEAASRQGEGELSGLGTSVFVVLLDLLSRRRLIRNVSDNLWSAQ